MTVETWVVYVATVFALMSTPGPSQLLMLSNSGTHGFRKALSTAAGALSAKIDLLYTHEAAEEQRG